MDYQQLKTKHRQIRDNQHTNLALRLHRSLSWLNRAEQCEDNDGKFIFLWVAFNAAYATEIAISGSTSEKAAFGNFFKKLCDLDKDDRLSALVWGEFSGSIRVLLDNKFVNHDFWEWQRGNMDEETWLSRLAASKTLASNSLGRQNTPKTLEIVFSRIYVLRNQLMHGGATWDSAVNRDQIRDCVNFMEKFIVEMLQVMMDGKPTLWGDACFPVVNI